MPEEFDIVGQVDIEIAKGLRVIVRAVRKALRYAVEISPVETGWYERNHRISINESSVPIDPQERPPRPGVIVSISATELVQRENEILARAKLGDTITMINSVPYAELIEAIGTKTQPEGQFYARIESYLEEITGGPLTTSGADSDVD